MHTALCQMSLLWSYFIVFSVIHVLEKKVVADKISSVLVTLGCTLSRCHIILHSSMWLSTALPITCKQFFIYVSLMPNSTPPPLPNSAYEYCIYSKYLECEACQDIVLCKLYKWCSFIHFFCNFCPCNNQFV
jgi:hypothetical protein